jgi:hypothetical protein
VDNGRLGIHCIVGRFATESAPNGWPDIPANGSGEPALSTKFPMRTQD